MHYVKTKTKFRPMIICVFCKTAFYRIPAIRRRNPKYCSVTCMSKAFLKDPPTPCLICGTPFQCSPSQKRLRNRKTCSRKCMGIFFTRTRSGSSASGWRGGISGVNRPIRYSAAMERWRQFVFKRDNWTCRYCYKRGGLLEAHHRLRFAWFPASRFHPSNGLTLCRECHDKTKKLDSYLRNECELKYVRLTNYSLSTLEREMVGAAKDV